MGAVIIGCGKALPNLEVANDDLQALVDTNDEWISSRTGISTRHIAVDESGLALAARAAAAALGMDGSNDPTDSTCGWTTSPIEPSSIDLVLFATVTPDIVVPSCAAVVKRMLGLDHAVAMDLNAACTGFIYGLSVAESMLAAANGAAGAAGRNPLKRALVIGCDRLSRVTDWSDRNTCVLFGDGAGAAVVEWNESAPGIMASYLRNDDDEKNALTCANYIEAPQPFSAEGIDQAARVNDPSLRFTDEALGIHEAVEAGGMRQVIRMDGRSIFKFASNAMTHAVEEVLRRTGCSLDNIDCVIPHQANERIIKFAAKKLGLDMDTFQLSIANTGNTSSASVPMALADAYVSGRVQPGDKVILVAFGGGLTSGAILYEA